MDDLPISAMIGALVVLLVLSGFFSGSETGLMTLNRYRLRTRAKAGSRAARLTEKLLERPDRLLGLILFGNNLVNIAASVLSGVIAMRLYGENALAAVPFVLTPIVLIFSELLPKTFAVLRPERVALPSAYVYYPLLKLFGWLIWLLNALSNAVLRLFGLSPENGEDHSLSGEELRTVLLEAGTLIPKAHRDMLLRILELEQATVEDIMVPRAEIQGIDLADDWTDIKEQLFRSQHTRLPVYEETIDNVIGILHLRRVFAASARDEFDRDTLRELLTEPYFIPEATPLHRQLLAFQDQHRRVGLVVDEYGDIQGLATLEDILEEIVGEFTSDPLAMSRDLTPDGEGAYIVAGTVPLRLLNRALGWELPTDGPKTLNGLILETLETIPQPNTSVLLDGYPVEIVQTSRNAVRTVRVRPASEESET
ncbi:MAG: HlyC/CorC family transporter [Gammaproteobacteria bacterium]|nr:HlyC/CorC family transporter [Gammaproteobacteria bacterium]